MKPSHRLAAGAVTVGILLSILDCSNATAAPSDTCDLRLTVELTPDVPDASDAGFISSLLNNHPDYRLDLLRQDGPSLIELDLAGPGPEYLCQRVIETMRRDARVLSVRLDSAETPTATIVITPAPAEEPSGIHLSSVGVGSLYWAAHHPSEAWRVLLPIRPDKLREWEDYYNYHRPHGALDGQTPYERLLAKKKPARVSPKS
jgi:hypothetical protein